MTLFPLPLLTAAVRTPAPRWKYVGRTRYRELPRCFALQVVALAAQAEPAREIDGECLAGHLAAKVRAFLVCPMAEADGTTREPEAQGGIGGWTHGLAAQVLLLAKRTPAAWDRLKADEHRRADLLMHALAVAAHHCLDDENDPYVLLDGWSLFHKSWNPNHVEGQVGVIMAAALYFGADALDAWFSRFDFDTFVAELEAANFSNIHRCWTAHPAVREWLMHGGEIPVPADQPIAAGVVSHSRGVRRPFRFMGHTLHEPWAMHRSQALRLFAKIVRTEVNIHGDRHTRLLQRATATKVSPYEGRNGMIIELENMDWAGLRSHLLYAYEAAMIDLPTAATLFALGEWRPAEGGDLIRRRMEVGLGDLRFRAREGYAGWSNGRASDTWWEKDLAPTGADFVFALWDHVIATPG